MKTEKITVKCGACESVEEFKQKIAENAKKHNLEFLLEYDMNYRKDENDENVIDITYEDEMNLCGEVFEWIEDDTNYGSVCQLDSYIREAKPKSEYSEIWDCMIGEYAKTRDTDKIEPDLIFDPNAEEADPEWKETLTSYVEMVCDVYNFLLS